MLPVLCGCAGVPREKAGAYYGGITTRAESPDTVLIATVNPPEHGRGVFGKKWEEHSFRAYVDGKSNQTRYELREAISYVAPQPKRFATVQLDTPAGAKLVTATSTGNEQDCAQYRSGTICTQIEHLTVDLNEDLLRAVARAGQAGASWRMEFHDAQGNKYVVQTPPGEVKGLLDAVEDQTTPHIRVYRPRRED